ncbi:MAG: class II aldolase/adducin family protein [Selenomonadales bacterium]|nr:class II aldolase/adducin family protein [Selenomonadales bacterium]
MKEQLCQAVIEYAHRMTEKGLIAGTWGNISVRIPDTDMIAITPSGRDYMTLVPSDIAIVNMKGEWVDGNYKPSSELPLHLAVYRARQDVGALIHTHSIYASACAAARRSIPAIIEDVAMMNGGDIEVAEYAANGSTELAANTVRALGEHQSVLLANHGMLGCGSNLKEAMTMCELVEKTARIFIAAQSLGGAVELDRNDVMRMRNQYLQHYRQV